MGKQLRLKLDPEKYHAQRLRVLKRDSWRCQICGSSTNLHIHHLRFRSRLGGDEIGNLITLCVDCHGKQHLRLARG